MSLPNLSQIEGFEWDKGNREKNEKHGVHFRECEEVFFNKPLFIFPDPEHSKEETRFQLLGVTNLGRRLFLSFTIRGKNIRVISARDQSKKERLLHEKSK